MKPAPKYAGSPAGQPESLADSFELDESAIEAAKRSIAEGVITPTLDLPLQKLIKLLNDALATEIVCVLRYRRHHFTVDGVTSPKIKEEFLVHAQEEQAHADRLAERIVQLGGKPDFSPDSLSARSHADYDESASLADMVRANLVAERVAIETYRQMIRLVGDRDPTTRQILIGILEDEEEHADELKDWLPRS
jgi:bacterioferritin